MSDLRDPPELEFVALGNFVAGHIDGVVSSTARLAARERLIRHADAAGSRSWWRVGGAVAIMVAASCALWWAWPRAPMPTMPPQVATVAPEAIVGGWVQAPTQGTATLPVGAGAVLALHDGARARVALADETRVAVTLEAGRLQAEVDPLARRHVTIEAGPYQVGVIGTVFRVDWQPTTGDFAVEVTRGKVEVRSPSSSAPIAVDAGHRLIGAADGALSLTTASADESPTEVAPSTPTAPIPADVKPSVGIDSTLRGKPRTKPESDAPPSWQALASDGKYAEAFAAVDAAGFDEAVATLPATALEQLGEVARLAGHPDQAAAAYLAIRKRFANSPAAARAAFQLGRHAADAKADPKAAVGWLRSYLDEAPRGSFAKLARGRLIAALADAGDSNAAREAARIYLDAYPDGPHAKMARALLEAP